ncbi:amino acid ABC transporter substrate-binding protein [Bifidobacterium criceti]|uniref:ABC transporter substrate-binding protein n=1 Tax=Bifidobacterium criceti TaxID=1960969 RepID=A0A2A2EG74_9BIFI|nr:amino acid ABC transporter substrate-binding protein [Bifidobacterium criceti]PAU67987.1 ABC transporter substrate-binding protein [Bifidobacterium criceti]
MSINKPATTTLSAIIAISLMGMCAACGTGDPSADAADADGAKVVTFVLESQDPPYAYADDNGQPAGFDLDVLKAIDDRLDDYTFEYEVLDYQTGLIGTKQGKYDAMIGAFFETPARAEQYLLSKPYNYFFMNLIVPQDSTIKTLEDLDGKTLDPIVPSDGRYVAITDWLKRHPDTKIEVPTVTNQETFQDMFNAVHDGSYDAVYLSKAQYEGVADTLGYELKVTDPVDAAGTVILYNKKQGDLQKAIDEQVDALLDDGTLPKLSEKWFKQDNYELAKELGAFKE